MLIDVLLLTALVKFLSGLDFWSSLFWGLFIFGFQEGLYKIDERSKRLGGDLHKITRKPRRLK